MDDALSTGLCEVALLGVRQFATSHAAEQAAIRRGAELRDTVPEDLGQLGMGWQDPVVAFRAILSGRRSPALQSTGEKWRAPWHRRVACWPGGDVGTIRLMSETTDFYRRPSPTSDLGRYRELALGLPADAEALGTIVRGLLIHDFVAKIRGLQFSAERMSQMQTVGAEAILGNVMSLDPSPLDFKRPAERRMVGFCYHFALLHCALLRTTGTPARVRCGFAGYFEARRWIDHWVVEYWDGDAWRLTDPQVGRSDLTRDDFQDGLTAWNQCRGGASMPALYGNGELWGWDELRGSLINDVAALNKVEIAGWYWCGRIKVDPLDQPHDELDASLDILSRLATTAESVETIQECFDMYPELQPPADAVAL